MRIVFLCNSPFWGGAEHYVIRLAQGLTESGHAAVLMAQPGSPLGRAGRDAPGVEVRDLDLGPKVGRRTVGDLVMGWRRYKRIVELALDECMAEGPIDVVHLQFKKEQLVATGVARQRGIPVVWTEHDKLPPPLTQLAPAMAIYRRTAAQVGRILCVSDFVRTNLIGNGLDPQHLTVCHNGIECEKVRPTRKAAEVRLEFGVEESDFLVGTVSRLWWTKGLTHLIKAAPAVLEQIPNARFLIVGDGEERERLEAQAAEAGVAEQLTFAGHRDDIPDLLAAFDVLASPSLQEGLCFSALEAMGAGLPVVASAVGGLVEAVVHEETGLLVPAEDPAALAEALIRVLGNDKMRAQMGSAGGHRVRESFTLDRMVDRSREVFEEAAGLDPASPVREGTGSSPVTLLHR